MARRHKKKMKISLYKPIIKGVIIRIGVLLVMAIFLFQFTALFTGMLFTDRLDETRAIALKYTFHALPFQSGDIISDVTGKKIALLNVTSHTQTYYLYSEDFTSDEIKNVGILEKDGQSFLVLWSSVVNDEKDYVIYGEFINFYKYGTREHVSVLLVESYHKFGLLDETISTNRFLFSQVTIGLVALTTACVLALIGNIFWFMSEIETMTPEDRPKGQKVKL